MGVATSKPRGQCRHISCQYDWLWIVSTWQHLASAADPPASLCTARPIATARSYDAWMVGGLATMAIIYNTNVSSAHDTMRACRVTLSRPVPPVPIT